jgi:hypothetical protein
MTDEELIARLNRWIEQQVLMLVDSDLLPIRDRIEAQAAEIERLRGVLAKAEWLLVDASVQLEEGKIKTRRNRASLIRQFLAELTGDKP